MYQRTATTPRRAARRWAAISAAALLLCACETIEHGRATDEVAGRTLATGGPPGAERLQVEIDYDAAVMETVREHGRPEYLRVVDRDNLFLFYTALDRVVQVRRNMIPPGVATEFAPIPGHLLKLLPNEEIERNQARRRARRPTARRRPQAAAPPAARSPAASETGRTLNRFDIEKLVERFRKPISAADPGLGGWRRVSLSDGSRAALARSGKTEYRIQSNTVTVVSPIGASSRKTPSGLKTGYYRVNRAVFGTKSHAISRKVAPIVASVAGDPSGRTRVARRVAGRVVQIFRDTGRGLIVYRVGTD
jgi:hypothetical protein